MGCTSSKENTNPPPTTITDDGQQLINDQFRKWLKSNRPKVDEYVLNDVMSTAVQPSNEIDSYRTIVTKALDLLSERHDIKTTHKLSKLVQKEVSLASPKQIAHTIDILKQTADKLRHGQIILAGDQPQTTNGEVLNDKNTHGQISSGQPGIALKEALETARVLFYKGKQAAIFANPNGGYDVRIIDENDDSLNHDGNLLRSIIVTEVKMRPKPTTTISPLFTAPPPPSKVLNEREICDDFRRSIDAALRGLEAIYQPSPATSPFEHTQEIHVDKKSSTNLPKIVQNDEKQQGMGTNDIHLRFVDDTNETTTQNAIPYETVEKSVTVLPSEHGETKENLLTKQSSSYSLGLTSPLQNDVSSTSSSPQEEAKLINEESSEKVRYDLNKKTTLNGLTHLTQTGLSNPNLNTSMANLGISTSSIKIEEEPTVNIESSTKIPTSISQILEEHNKILPESSSLQLIAPVDINTTVKSPSHNVTYTEIIHSESHDGEQSRRFITESYDEQPSKDDEQTTTLKVITKSEFSNHPSLGEKIMEQSVQVITVKVRNETVTTTTQPQTSDNDIASEKRSANELTKNDSNTIDTTI